MELLASQLMDPFRVGMIFFLLLTALRTREATGLIAPLLLGVVFIAILLPLTTARDASPTTTITTAIAAGVATNALILSALLAGWTAWTALRKAR